MYVGPLYSGDGTTQQDVRVGKTGEMITGTAHGKYFEAGSRGFICSACDVAGISTTTALGTTAILALLNPRNSGRRFAINKVSISYYSGTLGAGVVYHCLTPQVSGTALTDPSSGTLLTTYLTNPFNLSQYFAPFGVVRVGATVVQGIPVRPFYSIAANFSGVGEEDIDGEFVLEPGTQYQMQSICGSGTSPKITAGITWEEIPISSSQG